MPLNVNIECSTLVLEYYDDAGNMLDRTNEIVYSLGDSLTLNQPNADPVYDVRLIDGHAFYLHYPEPGHSIHIRPFYGPAGTIEFEWDGVDGPFEYRDLVIEFEFYQDFERPVIAKATLKDREPDRTVIDLPERPDLTALPEIRIKPDPANPWESVHLSS